MHGLMDGATSAKMAVVDGLMQVILATNILGLDVSNRNWDSARGYLVDPDTWTLYFPVATKYLVGRDLDRYQVVISSGLRVVVTGRLSPATSAVDIETARRLAVDSGQDSARVDYMLFDQRNHKPRKNRHKLIMESIDEVGADGASREALNFWRR